MTDEERQEMGKKGQEYVNKKYNFNKYIANWRETLKNVHEKNGSWETRKNYNSWELLEV